MSLPAAGVAPYARHSRWTDPGRFAGALDALPGVPARLPGIVGGLVLHPLFAPERPAGEASLRGAADILAAIVARDPRPLDTPRPAPGRVIGTCRNYALLACAILRQHGVPARLRVGFADYFKAGYWEDHWLCEVHDGAAWRLVDAELTPEACRGFGIGFDPAAVPRKRFLTAGPAWLELRRGAHDPARFGVSFLGLAGLGFVAGSLLRDLASLTMEEMMPWDHWGPAREFRPDAPPPPEWLGRLDDLASAIAGAEAGYDAARQVLAAYPWAALTDPILSFPEGKPVDVQLATG